MTPLWMQWIFTIFLIGGGIYLYIQPMLQAYQHKHPQRRAIAVLNVLAGWTLLGWIVALTWAHLDSEKPQPRNPHLP